MATDWHGTRRDDIIATWRDVLERLGRDGVAIVDTRTPEEHGGTLVRAARGGAIPGSIHLEWIHNLGAAGRFKPAAELREMYARHGITPERDVVTYCQGGYRGAHSYLALRSWLSPGPQHLARGGVVRSPRTALFTPARPQHMNRSSTSSRQPRSLPRRVQTYHPSPSSRWPEPPATSAAAPSGRPPSFDAIAGERLLEIRRVNQCLRRVAGSPGARPFCFYVHYDATGDPVDLGVAPFEGRPDGRV